ncbi:MAG: hypothetical protein QHJ73_12330, partial [Armatimonadota bacterium]|nr:hypothetical protein [Armatimonadota bacterium]
MGALFTTAVAAAAVLLGGVAVAAPLPRWEAVVSTSGSIRLLEEHRDFGVLEPGLFEEGWRGASLRGGRSWEVPPDGVRRGEIRAASGLVVDTELRAEPAAGGLKVDYRLIPKNDARLNSLNVHLSVPTSLLAGGRYMADGKRGTLPVKYAATHVFRADVRVLELTTAAGNRLRFEFAQPTPVLIQDDRQWGPSFSLRFGPEGDPLVWAGGRPLAVAFTLSAPGGMAVEYDAPVTIVAGDEWVPLDADLEIEPGSALDFTHLVPWHEPAGKLGRVVATRDGKMAFSSQPDQPVRFYGFNLCFSAHYISHEEADRLAARLRRLGYNAVRFHHYESGLVDRSGGTSTRLHPERLDEIDYLFAALKRQGIYVTTDLFVSRPVFAAEVWEGADGQVEMDEYKMAVPVNERAFQNFLAFTRALLGHRNPYTGLTWAEDPALAWLSLINEGNPGNFIGRMSEPLKADYTRAWNAWLARRYPTRDALAKALGKLEPGEDPATESVPLPAFNPDSPRGIQLSLFL